MQVNEVNEAMVGWEQNSVHIHFMAWILYIESSNFQCPKHNAHLSKEEIETWRSKAAILNCFK